MLSVRHRARLVFISALLIIMGCGKELGRVPFAKEGSGSTTVALKAGEVSFWTDIDLEYEGSAALDYEVELSQGGTKIATASCDPLARLSVKSMWAETNIGDKHTRNGSGKLDCTVSIPASGSTTVTVVLAFSSKPKSVTLRKADLVIKQ